MLELSQLLAHCGLGGVQLGRGARYVESRIHDGAQTLELTQLHGEEDLCSIYQN